MIRKAPGYGADALCLVLEDSVPESLKAEARETVRAAIPELAAQGLTVMVKTNAPGGGLEADLAQILQPGLAGVIVPKVQEVQQVRRLDDLLEGSECELVLLIETPLALVRAFDLAAASAKVCALAGGTAANGDLARELGFRWTREGLERLYLRSKVLTDSRAAGCQMALDGAFTDLRDPEGLGQEAGFARQLGYNGKLCVHPAQVEVVNRAFTPTEAEVEHHRRVLDAFEEALREGRAAIVVDGVFVDYAMAATARRVLELAAR